MCVVVSCMTVTEEIGGCAWLGGGPSEPPHHTTPQTQDILLCTADCVHDTCTDSQLVQRLWIKHTKKSMSKIVKMLRMELIQNIPQIFFHIIIFMKKLYDSSSIPSLWRVLLWKWSSKFGYEAQIS